jgi:hypothetical protein
MLASYRMGTLGVKTFRLGLTPIAGWERSFAPGSGAYMCVATSAPSPNPNKPV